MSRGRLIRGYEDIYLLGKEDKEDKKEMDFGASGRLCLSTGSGCMEGW